MDHDCRNSVTFQFKNKFLAFLRASRAASEGLPDTLEGLASEAFFLHSWLHSSLIADKCQHLIIMPLSFAREAGIHPVIAPGDNLKGGVFVPWRVALYVAGDEASVHLPGARCSDSVDSAMCALTCHSCPPRG